MANNKNRRALKRMKVRPAVLPTILDQSTFDKNIIDIILNTLYNNSHTDAMHLENEIYKPNNVTLSPKETERIWEILKASGWVTPVIGFGNSGKIEMTREGYQLMAQYGSYKSYLNALQAPQQQTFIVPFQLGTGETEEPEVKNPSTPKRTKGKR
jgi:hypothetical protein